MVREKNVAGASQVPLCAMGLFGGHVALLMADYATPERPFRDLHIKSDLLNGINVIWVVKSLSEKYSAFQNTQISDTSLPVPAYPKGAFAVVTDAGQGMRWTGMVLVTRASFADGKIVWS